MSRREMAEFTLLLTFLVAAMWAAYGNVRASSWCRAHGYDDGTRAYCTTVTKHPVPEMTP